MKTQQLEDLTLLLVRDGSAASWLDRWAVSYPTVAEVVVDASDSIAVWQRACDAVWQAIPSDNVMVVAHGAGALAWMAWLYQADIITQKRLCSVLLAAPDQGAWQEDAMHTLARARLNCRAALVCTDSDDVCPQDWARQLAVCWGARFFVAPQAGHLQGHLHGWQWGMKLMQEMLLSD